MVRLCTVLLVVLGAYFGLLKLRQLWISRERGKAR
jgi:hypothetical protein